MHEATFRKRLGRALRRARLERGLTQRVLARRARVTEKYLSRVELGLVTPSSFVVFQLCKNLGVELGRLVTEKQQRSRRPELEGAVRVLRARTEAEIERARRILVELFR